MEKKWWTLLAVCVGTFMLLLDVTIVVVAIPDIQRGLHASFGQIQWVIDAYALTLASLLLTAGVLADRYGRRLLFSIGLVIFTLGSLLCGLAQDPLMLILSRSGQGIGGAIMFATSLALLGNSFRGKDRGGGFRGLGRHHGSGRVARPDTRWGHHYRDQLAGHLPGQRTYRRGGGGHHVVASRRVARPAPGTAGLDRVRLLTAGLISLVYGLIRAGETSWGNAGVLICLVLGGILLAGFALAEARVTRPDVRPRSFSRPHVRRRPYSRLLHERLAVCHAPLPRALPPVRARVLRPPDRPTLASHKRPDPGHGHGGRPSQRARTGPMADRPGPGPGRSGAVPHDRSQRYQFVDAFGPGFISQAQGPAS